MLLLLLILGFGNPKPMNVVPGDPILDIDVYSLDGEILKLKDTMDTSFCFVLSLNCDYCRDALAEIQARISPEHHTVLVFVEDVDAVRDFVDQTLPEGHGMDIYTVNADELEPYKIQTLPALLLYHRRALALAFHGPINPRTSKKVLSLYKQSVSR